MTTRISSEENITWNFSGRMLYALQVIIIAIAIPVLSYMEMTHVEKTENPSVKSSSVIMEKSNAVVLTLK